MMSVIGATLNVRLIGRPRLERDGLPVEGPRGKKAWALLGRLVRAAEPLSRQQLVDELFSEADDPMGALRWSLAELRRRLDAPDLLTGNPVRVDLPTSIEVDVTEIVAGRLTGQVADGHFLEGVGAKTSASFETWLLVERQRVDGEVLDVLRQSTLRALSSRDHARAVELAAAMVRRSPFDEGHHVLLVKALAASGDAQAARQQVEASERLFERDLGVAPTPAIRAAARPAVAGAIPGVPSAATARSLLDAGLAALSAGAVDAGLECLRGATAAAEESRDSALLAGCQMELGTALVHAIRGYDDEGSVMLQQAVESAHVAGAPATAAKALSELGYVDILAARRHSAARHLAAAWELVPDDPALAASVVGFDAMNLNDWGRLEEAAERFDEALELARQAGAVRREAWTLGLGARTQHALGQLDTATEWARRSCELVNQERWTAFRPWPEVWLAHSRLARGELPGTVRHDAEVTFALARQIQDPCWEGATAELVALTHLAEHDVELARIWVADASTMCRRVTDSYRWLEVDILLVEAEVAQRSGDVDRATTLAQQAIADAAMGAMDAHLARARSLLG